MNHELVIHEQDDGAVTGTCTGCDWARGPFRSGSGTVMGRTPSDRIPKSWTGTKVLETDFRCHAFWQEAVAAGNLDG